jgi:hypothetical protein
MGTRVEAGVPGADRLPALLGLGRVRAEDHQDRRGALRDAARGGEVDRPAVALGLAVPQLRLDDHRQHRLTGGRVRDEYDHVREVLHGHDRAHVGRGKGDGHLPGKLDSSSAADKLHGDLGMFAHQVKGALMGH